MIDATDARVGVTGLEYVDPLFVLLLADAGYDASSVDIDEDRIEQLQTEQSYGRDVSDGAVEGTLEADYETVDIGMAIECTPLVFDTWNATAKFEEVEHLHLL